MPWKSLKNNKLFDFEMCYVKLKYTDINFIKAICENPTRSFRLVIDEGEG